MPDTMIQMQTLRAPDLPEWSDEQLGRKLASLVMANLPNAPTSAVVVRTDSVHVCPLRPVAESEVPIGVFLAGLCGWHPPDGPAVAVGVAGRMTYRPTRDGAPVPVASVYLEWPDCRWWRWWQVLDAEGEPIEGSALITRATDGTAKPSGFGGWWTYARTRQPKLTMALTRSEQPEIVH